MSLEADGADQYLPDIPNMGDPIPPPASSRHNKKGIIASSLGIVTAGAILWAKLHNRDPLATTPAPDPNQDIPAGTSTNIDATTQPITQATPTYDLGLPPSDNNPLPAQAYEAKPITPASTLIPETNSPTPSFDPSKPISKDNPLPPGAQVYEAVQPIPEYTPTPAVDSYQPMADSAKQLIIDRFPGVKVFLKGYAQYADPYKKIDIRAFYSFLDPPPPSHPNFDVRHRNPSEGTIYEYSGQTINLGAPAIVVAQQLPDGRINTEYVDTTPLFEAAKTAKEPFFPGIRVTSVSPSGELLLLVTEYPASWSEDGKPFYDIGRNSPTLYDHMSPSSIYSARPGGKEEWEFDQLTLPKTFDGMHLTASTTVSRGTQQVVGLSGSKLTDKGQQAAFILLETNKVGGFAFIKGGEFTINQTDLLGPPDVIVNPGTGEITLVQMTAPNVLPATETAGRSPDRGEGPRTIIISNNSGSKKFTLMPTQSGTLSYVPFNNRNTLEEVQTIFSADLLNIKFFLVDGVVVAEVPYSGSVGEDIINFNASIILDEEEGLTQTTTPLRQTTYTDYGTKGGPKSGKSMGWFKKVALDGSILR